LIWQEISKVNRLEPSESAITSLTNSRHCWHLMASLLKQIFHLHPWGFSTTKCFISFRQRLEMSKGNSTLYESKWSKRPSKSFPGTKHTWFHLNLTSGKRLLWSFWPCNVQSSKKSHLNLFLWYLNKYLQGNNLL